MLSTLYIKTEFRDVKALFEDTYYGERFVTLLDTPPMTKWVLGTNNCLLYTHYDERTSTAIVISAIDNLGKGASLQAVQNMNLMLGWDEDLSIPVAPLFP